MGLFKKKCGYCDEKIKKGQELFRDVKDPLFTNKKQKSFCCEECADAYENKLSSCCKSGRGCCG